MHGKVTDEEWEVFKQAYLFFSEHCDPPANQDGNALPWWTQAANDVVTVDQKWAQCPLMRCLLLAIYEYIELKAKEKTKESEDFVQEF